MSEQSSTLTEQPTHEQEPSRRGTVRTGPWADQLAGTLTKQGVVIVLTLFAIVPLYFMVATSFKTRVAYAQDQLGLPTAPTLENFTTVLGNPMFLTWIANSLLLTVVAVSVGIALSTAAAYALSCMEFRGRQLVFICFIALLGAPTVALVIPLFRVMVTVGLINSLQGVMILYIGLMIPYTTYFLTAFFRRLPESLFEAAQMDGAGHWVQFTRIALPLSKPGVITLTLVNTLWVWNELLVSIVFLQQNDKRTLMGGLTVFQGEFSSNVPAIMAGLCVAVLPMFILYVAGLRYFMSGLMAGSEKG
ncbi:carbohydrate ABC transporter permease [Nocardioides rotundus]|uniref:carbohydrate ABC transporter permease n=1 Tax=Nocardioides rotundus TaxID=1774216 RepID=UPI001CC08271|nr:carbohydrate ABC transporter permease [Nocardioides rotundus]UAL31429.1 carbohydrate ABC transporter permease [Nocardioides rotundus]